ncbi:MAG: hypothetical protein ACE5D6_08905 [Candidatus Zixiibacteriota bacterium]
MRTKEKDKKQQNHAPDIHVGFSGLLEYPTTFSYGNVRLHHCDCMDFMASKPDGFYDLAIVDPPYGIGNFTQSDRLLKYGNYEWNDKKPTNEYFEELRRISKHRIIWGANYYNCFENGHASIIWDKMNPHPSMSRCEIASVSWNKRVDYIQIMHYGSHQDKGNSHPCGKPIQLYKWLLKNYAKKGDKIIENFYHRVDMGEGIKKVKQPQSNQQVGDKDRETIGRPHIDDFFLSISIYR